MHDFYSALKFSALLSHYICPEISAGNFKTMHIQITLIFLPSRNYGYFKPTDDYMTWFLRNAKPGLPKHQLELLRKGRVDNTTFVEISVMIIYTPEFVSMLGAYPETAVYLIAARTMEVF